MASENSPAILERQSPPKHVDAGPASTVKPGGSGFSIGRWFEPAPEATLAALLVIAVLICYVNILGNSFVYDDEQQILQNPYVKDWRFLPQIFGTTVWSFVGQAGATNYYRPLMTFTFLVLWKLFGPIPFGFHLFSLAMHAAVVVILFYVGSRLFADRRIAWLSALLFAVHPIHTEAVAWIASIPDLEATFFVLLSLWALAKPGRLGWKNQAMALGSFALALLSKEPSLMLAPLVIAYEHGVRAGHEDASIARKLTRYAPLVLLGGAYLGLRIALFGKLAPVLQHAQYSWPTAIYSAFALTLSYARMLVWPARLSAFHVFHASTSLLDARVLGGIALVGLGIAAIVILWRRVPVVSFSILWFGVTLAPVLNARWMAANVQTERYLYLPSVGFCWLAAWCAVRVTDLARRASASARTAAYNRLARSAVFVALGVVCVFFTSATITRNRVWSDDVTLYTQTLRVDPDGYVMHLNLGICYYGFGNNQAAKTELQRALALRPDSVNALNTLGVIAMEEGGSEQAADFFKRAIALKPEWADAHFDYARLLQNSGRRAEADAEFQRAIQLAPLSAAAHLWYGEALLEDGRASEAELQLKQSLALQPSVKANQDLAQLYTGDGRLDLAEATLDRLIAENPFDEAAHVQRGRLLERLGRPKEAKKEYQAVLSMDPANKNAKDALEKLKP